MSRGDPLAALPNLAAVRSARGGRTGLFGTLVESGDGCVPLIEATVGSLDMTSRPSLAALADDLFSEDWGRLWAAVHEILAFGWMKSRNAISEPDIGYPGDWDSDDPPFEGVLRGSQEDVAFDVKDGSGSGLLLLAGRVRRVVADFAGPNPVPKVHVAADAPMGQRWFGENFPRIIRLLSEDLIRNGLTPRKIQIEAGSGYVKIGLDSSVGGSLLGLDEKAAFLATQVLGHVSDKSKKLALTQAAGFALFYVRRPCTGGSDFGEYEFQKALDYACASSDLPANLRGIGLLDFSVGEGAPSVMLWDRHGALEGKLGVRPSDIYTPAPRAMPAETQRAACSIDPSTLSYSGAIVAGSCDLRAQGCTARGSIGTVFPFHGPDKIQYLACTSCIAAHGWPLPGRKT